MELEAFLWALVDSTIENRSIRLFASTIMTLVIKVNGFL